MERLVRPRAQVLEVMRGVVSDPVETISNKPGSVGEAVRVSLVREGVGMAGLANWRDNREWSGINNHEWLSARYGVYFSTDMKKAGYDTDPERVLNTMLDSHKGRRQWDEAGWYPQAVPDAAEKRSISNETLGMRLIQGKVPGDVFELVVALGHNVEGFSVDPAIYDSWDYRIAIYVDHRTTQRYELLNTRMGDFLLGNFYGREEVTLELREKVYREVKDIIDRQKRYRFGEGEEVTLDEADQIAEKLGASADSERLTRKDLMRLILQDADTEAAIIEAGIDPDVVSDEKVPMPRWECYLRRLYINDAEDQIMWMYVNQMNADQEAKASGVVAPSLVDRDFPESTWWGRWVRVLAEIQDLRPYVSGRGKATGIERAINFFRYLDQVGKAKEENKSTY